MFTPKERRIYQYPMPDGTTRFADPMRIRRRLSWKTTGLIDDIVVQQQSDLAHERLAAEDKIIEATAFAFDLPIFNDATGEGCTDDYLLELFDDFDQWRDGLKKNGSRIPFGIPYMG